MWYLILLAICMPPLQADGKSLLQAGCSFNLDTSSPEWPPHLIDTNKEIILPILEESNRVINLDVGQEVTIGCIGFNNTLNATQMQLNLAVCTAQNTLQVRSNGVEYTYDQLGCITQNLETLREVGTCANGEGTTIRVGWEAGPDYIPLFDQCHDKVKALNYFSTKNIYGKTAAADDKDNDRPYYFSQANYYPGIDVNTAYTQVQQAQTVADIVGSEALAALYINVSADHYFARGHLAPDGDFVDAASQDASYYFMNVAPQFQSFNNGNWKWLEIGVRKEAVARDVLLVVYTGTYEVLKLTDIKGVPQPIYLVPDGNGSGLIPAPKYYWKVIHDPLANTATAVVGMNNPHLQSVTTEDIFCPDVCQEIPWIEENIYQPHNFDRGYTFCCTASALREIVSFAPDLGDIPLFI